MPESSGYLRHYELCCIAHRLSAIKHADKIVVIEDGRFVEEGSLSELLKKQGRFYHYWKAQRFF